MGGIYQHALNMLLEEDLTLDEMVCKAVERYELDEEMARFYLELEIAYHHVGSKCGKYHKTHDIVDPVDMVIMFEKMPDTYFDTRPGMYALYVDCRVKAGLF